MCGLGLGLGALVPLVRDCRSTGGTRLEQIFLGDNFCSNCSTNFVFLFVFWGFLVESSVCLGGSFWFCLVGATIELALRLSERFPGQWFFGVLARV